MTSLKNAEHKLVNHSTAEHNTRATVIGCWNGYFEILRFWFSKGSNVRHNVLKTTYKIKVPLSVVNFVKEHSDLSGIDERCLVFVSWLPTKKNKCLHSKILERVLGRNYLRIIEILIKNSIVEQSGTYRVGHHCKSYRLCPYFRSKKVPVRIQSPKLVEHLRNARFDCFLHRLRQHPFYVQKSIVWQLNTLKDIVESEGITPEGFTELKSESEEPKNHTAKTVLRILQGKDTGKLNLKPNGRFYHPFCSASEDVRNRLLIGGEPVTSLDIRASHPSFLLSMASSHQRRNEDWQMAVELIKKRMLYRAYVSIFENLSISEQSKVKSKEEPIINCTKEGVYENNPEIDSFEYIEPTDEFKVEQERLLKSCKCYFQYLINTPGYLNTNIPESLARYPLSVYQKGNFSDVLRYELPTLFNILDNLKRFNPAKGAVANIIQGQEATLIHTVVAELAGRGIKCVSVYDSISVPTSRADEAEAVFNEILSKTLGFEVTVKRTNPQRIEEEVA